MSGEVTNLAIDGVELATWARAEHRGDVHVEVVATLGGRLPLLGMRPRTARPPLAAVYGPELDVGRFAFDGPFIVRSEALELPARLFDRDAVLAAVGGVVGYLDLLEIRPDPSGVRVAMRIRTGESQTRRDDALRFGRAVIEATRDVIAFDARLTDARAALDDGAVDGEPPEERVQRLVEHVTDATHWLAGHAERVGASIEARLRLGGGGLEQEGRLLLGFRDPEIRSVRLTLHAQLPVAVHDDLRLAPEGRGLTGLLRRLGELEVGDAALDDAFVIRASRDPAPLLLHARGRLLQLGRLGARVDIDETGLLVRVASVDADDDALLAAVEPTLELWWKCACFVAGLADEPPPA
jgi:hypothetical protein